MNTTLEVPERKWRTADNNVIPFSKVTHQHWSNIYWYHLIFQKIDKMPIGMMNQIVLNSMMDLAKRFSGEILNWKPVFSYEIGWLNQLKMIKENKIIFEGKEIGEIDLIEIKNID